MVQQHSIFVSYASTLMAKAGAAMALGLDYHFEKKHGFIISDLLLGRKRFSRVRQWERGLRMTCHLNTFVFSLFFAVAKFPKLLVP